MNKNRAAARNWVAWKRFCREINGNQGKFHRDWGNRGWRYIEIEDGIVLVDRRYKPTTRL